MHPLHDNYPTAELQELQANASRSRRKRRLPSKDEIIQQAVQELDERVRARVHNVHYQTALTILEAILAIMGKIVPQSPNAKQNASREWVDEEMRKNDWFLPGELVTVDYAALRRLFPPEYFIANEVVQDTS